MITPTSLAELEAYIYAQVPLAHAMQLRVEHCDAVRVVLTAPLAANANDKGTGFAGSLSSLLMLAGWCLATRMGEMGGARCEAAVYQSELNFLRPVRETLRAEAWIDELAVLDRFHAQVAAGRRGKLLIAARLGAAADPAVVFAGRYAVWQVGMPLA